MALVPVTVLLLSKLGQLGVVGGGVCCLLAFAFWLLQTVRRLNDADRSFMWVFLSRRSDLACRLWSCFLAG